MTAPLTFIWGGTWRNPSKIPGGMSLLVFDVMEDAIYAVYLVLILNISYLNRTRRVEIANQAKIMRHHFRRPVYWLLAVGATTHIWTLCGADMLLNNIKIVRGIQYLLVWPDSMWRWQGEHMSVRIITPLVYLILASHWVACLMSSLGGYKSKVDEVGFDEFSTQWQGRGVSGEVSLYIMAFVESIYMLTAGLDNPLGEGDSIRHNAFGSLLLVALFGPIGCVVVAVFISAIVREQTLWFVLENRHAENKAFILRALQNFNIPEDLQRRVLALHEYQKMGFDREAFDILFNKNNLSPPLDLALRVYVYHDSALRSSPYFAGKEANYILDIIAGFQDRIYLPSDYVIRRGQIGEDMFFIIRGEVSILVPDPEWTGPRTTDHTVEVSCKRQGDYFGEIALVRHCVRTAWVRANTYVLVSLFTRAHAQTIWKHFPNERAELVQLVTTLAGEDRERSSQKQALDTRDTYVTPSSMALREAAEHQEDHGGDRLAPDPVMNLLTGFIEESRKTAALKKDNFLALQAQMSAMESRHVEFEASVRDTINALEKTRSNRRNAVRHLKHSSTNPEHRRHRHSIMSKIQ